LTHGRPFGNALSRQQQVIRWRHELPDEAARERPCARDTNHRRRMH
jgi:hypothetical protein